MSSLPDKFEGIYAVFLCGTSAHHGKLFILEDCHEPFAFVVKPSLSWPLCHPCTFVRTVTK